MKNLLLFILTIIYTLQGYSQQNYVLSTSKIQIAGTSTLHDWTANVTKASGKAIFSINEENLTAVREMKITMQAGSIKSDKGAMMDKNIYRAMKADKYPEISFSLEKIRSITANGMNSKLSADGKLTIAGTTKSISLVVTGKTINSQSLAFSGSYELKMTDYKVEPPVLMLGTLKTGDLVAINFELTFSTGDTSMK